MKRSRAALRIAIRAKRGKLKGRVWKYVRRVLRDKDLQTEVISRLERHTGMRVKEFGDGSLLDWFLENWEVILEIILTIIGLIGGAADRRAILKLHTFEILDPDKEWAAVAA